MEFLYTGNFNFSPWWSFGYFNISYSIDKDTTINDFIGLNYYGDPVMGFNTNNYFGTTHFPG